MSSQIAGHAMLEAINTKSGQAKDNLGHLWSIILAGGNGDRISDLTRQWLGRPIPKQYCAFVGNRSMLQHTLLRADKLGIPNHQRTLIARAHQNDAQPQLADRWEKGVILQPSNRDTLPGIFLPLTHVYAHDSNATVVIYPSDHFIYPQNNFIRMMEHAVQAAEESPHMLVLIGAPADSPELDYGWIWPGQEVWRSGNYCVRRVQDFSEKPSRPCAERALACGAMWNTLIIVAKAQLLWRLGWIYAPEVLRFFERLFPVIGTPSEGSVVESIYETMPARNFSKDLLRPATNRIGVLPMKDVLWSDWGRKERIIDTLCRIGKEPNFASMPETRYKPVEQAEGSFPIAS
jgi:mannose-1-phosphate guanylyltransferase